MKKQMMTALAVSAMMTLAMPFASFAAGRSCQPAYRPGNNCSGYAGTNIASVIQMQGGCVNGAGNVMDVYALLGTSCRNWTNGNGCGNNCGNNCDSVSGGSCLSGTTCGSTNCDTSTCGSGNCSVDTCGSSCQTKNPSGLPSGFCNSIIRVR